MHMQFGWHTMASDVIVLEVTEVRGGVGPGEAALRAWMVTAVVMTRREEGLEVRR